jgi:hypothetical protein
MTLYSPDTKKLWGGNMKPSPRPNGNMKIGFQAERLYEIDFFSQKVEIAHYKTQLFFGCRREWLYEIRPQTKQ